MSRVNQYDWEAYPGTEEHQPTMHYIQAVQDWKEQHLLQPGELQMLRGFLCLSVKQVGVEAGISETVLRTYEDGFSRPKPEIHRRWQVALLNRMKWMDEHMIELGQKVRQLRKEAAQCTASKPSPESSQPSRTA